MTKLICSCFLSIILPLSALAAMTRTDAEDDIIQTCAVSNEAASASEESSLGKELATVTTPTTSNSTPATTPPTVAVPTDRLQPAVIQLHTASQESCSCTKSYEWPSWIGSIASAMIALFGAFGAAWFAYHLSNRGDAAIRRRVASEIIRSLTDEVKSNELTITRLPGNLPALRARSIGLSTAMWKTYENRFNEGVLSEIFRAIGNDNGTDSTFPLREFLTHTNRYFCNICPLVNGWIAGHASPSQSDIQQIQEAALKVRATLEQIERKLR